MTRVRDFIADILRAGKSAKEANKWQMMFMGKIC
jgi:hypothetical protein